MSGTTDLPLAVAVGDYEIVVVHMNGETERFGLFPGGAEAADWAMRHRSSLKLDWCASWHIAQKNVPTSSDFESGIAFAIRAIGIYAATMHPDTTGDKAIAAILRLLRADGVPDGMTIEDVK